MTSFPGGKTATGAQSPLTVSGLKNGAGYTFSVSATNASGVGPESASSNSVVPVELPRLEIDPPAPEPRAPTPTPPPVAVPRPIIPGH